MLPTLNPSMLLGTNHINLALMDLQTNPFEASDNEFKRTTTTSARHKNITDIPATVDRRKRGAVTPVKNQRGCGNIK